MPALLQDRQTADSVVPRPRARRRVPFRLIAAGAAVALLLPAGLQIREWMAGIGNPMEPEVIDRSTPPLLLALDDLHEYHAATANLEVMVDYELDTPWVPSVISGERVNLLAYGSVDAYVDLENLDAGAVTLSPDGASAAFVLPAPEMSEVRIDTGESRVVDRDRGLVERFGSAVLENPTDDSAVYALAERRLATAATESDLLDRAETNTREMLTGLAQSLGVEDVTVVFEAPARDAG